MHGAGRQIKDGLVLRVDHPIHVRPFAGLDEALRDVYRARPFLPLALPYANPFRLGKGVMVFVSIAAAC
jgi:hypothetical protein